MPQLQTSRESAASEGLLFLDCTVRAQSDLRPLFMNMLGQRDCSTSLGSGGDFQLQSL